MFQSLSAVVIFLFLHFVAGELPPRHAYLLLNITAGLKEHCEPRRKPAYCPCNNFSSEIGFLKYALDDFAEEIEWIYHELGELGASETCKQEVLSEKCLEIPRCVKREQHLDQVTANLKGIYSHQPM